MGKRELLLIVVFVIVGAVIYQATAPPASPNDRGFSLSRFMDAARREIRGRRASAEETTSATHPISGETTELRILGPISELEITGEARPDVETTFQVRSNGFDDADAKRLVKASKVVADRAASAIILRAEFPRDGTQRGTLKVKIPSRLRVRVEPGSARFTVTNVSEVEIASTRGEATIRKIAGKVDIVHRGGDVVVEDAGSLRFSGRAGTLTVTNVRGDTSIRLEQGGDVTLAQLAGEVDVESRNAEVTLEGLDATRGPIRVNAVGGNVRMKGLKSEARVDARGSELDVTMSAAAAVSLYTEGETVSLTPPPAGFKLDAVVVDGQISPEDAIEKMGFKYSATPDAKERRAYGAIKGGGPTITIRTTRGDLHLRTQDDQGDLEKKTDTEKKTELKKNPARQ
jgi:hypothetical protein